MFLLSLEKTRSILLFLALCFSLNIFLPYGVQANVLPYMPKPGVMIALSEKGDLPLPLAIEFKDNNPFNLIFILSRTGNNSPVFIKSEAEKVAKYFFAALTMPPQDLWVNLSPYEQDRVTTQDMAQTELGKDLLGEDYVLKQLASSLTYPESESGKAYWRSVNSELPLGASLTKLGSEPIQSFNKVWIVPGEMLIEESKGKARIAKAQLKVMCEEDYLAMQKNGKDAINHVSTPNADAFRQHILPSIEQEVNQGNRFAHLRQIYYAVMLAGWFKHKLHDTVLAQTFFDKNKIQGVNCNDPAIREKIYNEYVKAFKTGVYNYVKKESVRVNDYSSVQKTIKHAYFSGGVEIETAVTKATIREKPQGILFPGGHAILCVVEPLSSKDVTVRNGVSGELAAIPVVGEISSGGPTVKTEVDSADLAAMAGWVADSAPQIVSMLNEDLTSKHDVPVPPKVAGHGGPIAVVQYPHDPSRPIKRPSASIVPAVGSRSTSLRYNFGDDIRKAVVSVGGEKKSADSLALDSYDIFYQWLDGILTAANLGLYFKKNKFNGFSQVKVIFFGDKRNWDFALGIRDGFAKAMQTKQPVRATIVLSKAKILSKEISVNIVFVPYLDTGDLMVTLTGGIFFPAGGIANNNSFTLRGIMKYVKDGPFLASYGNVPWEYEEQIDERLRYFFTKVRNVLSDMGEKIDKGEDVPVDKVDKAVVELLRREGIIINVVTLQKWRATAEKNGLSGRNILFVLAYDKDGNLQSLWDVNGQNLLGSPKEFHAAAHWSPEDKNNSVYISIGFLLLKERSRRKVDPESQHVYMRVRIISEYESKNFLTKGTVGDVSRLYGNDKKLLDIARLSDLRNKIEHSPNLYKDTFMLPILSEEHLFYGLIPLCRDSIANNLSFRFNRQDLSFSFPGKEILAGIIHAAYASHMPQCFRFGPVFFENQVMVPYNMNYFLLIKRQTDGSVECLMGQLTRGLPNYSTATRIFFTSQQIERRAEMEKQESKARMAAARQLDVSGGVELERAVSNAAIKCEVSGGGVHFDPAWGDNNIKGIFFTVKIIKL